MKRILFVIFFIVPVFSYAAENPVWVDSEGEAYLGQYDTPKEIMERAKRDAQSKAIEKAVGVFIKSHTLVSNSQLAEDLVYASVRGKIDKVDIVKEGWDERDRNLYRVKLRSLIKPVYPEKGEGISLNASLSKSILREGEEVKIFFQSGTDCHVYIFSVGADGSVTLLLPNSVNRDNFIKGGNAYTFPTPESGIKLTAMFLPEFKGKFTEERIKVIATRNKEDLIQLGFQEGIFKAYDAKSTGMISELVKKLNMIEPSDWTEATVVFKIQR